MGNPWVSDGAAVTVRHPRRARGTRPQHVGDPVGRVVRVDREERGTGLEYAEARHDQFHGAGQHERDDLFRPHVTVEQCVREPVGSGGDL